MARPAKNLGMIAYDIHNWPVATETDVPLHLTTGRDITDMAYDHRNLPTQIKFSNGSTQRNTYNADGALIQMALTHKSSGIGNLKRPTIRIYAADRVWENNKLQYSYFPGGYFDADGGVQWLLVKVPLIK